MLTAKKTNSIAKSIFKILLTAVLLITTQLLTAYAADNNPAFSTLDAFPDLYTSLDTMNENLGTINTLYGGGTIKDNKGHISSSYGTVYENHGSIESLSAGHVGTNYGTINRIDNSGSLGVNDTGGTVLCVVMGNEVKRNDGTIKENIGKVFENFGTVSDNYGTVIMCNGKIESNHPNGTALFEVKISGSATIPAKGAIDHNGGSVIISSGTVTVKENTGNIVITNADVSVSENAGSITLGANATLKCDVNKSGGVITKSDESAKIICYQDNGHIYDEATAKYKIVFAGDDGKAVVIACDLEKDGVYYTQVGGGVVFTLPPEYECSAARKLESGNVNIWGLNANPAQGDTEFTIICHKCIPGPYRMTADKHWQVCGDCGKMFTATESTHTFGKYVSDENSTCVRDGTETCLCTVCKYRYSRRIEGSHLTSNHHEHVVIDQRVEPTETSTGLTQGSHCEDCHKVLTAQKIIAALSIDQTNPTDPNFPQTGDNSNMLLWAVLLFVSSGAFAGTVAFGKIRKQFG